MARTIVAKSKPNLTINYSAYPTAQAFHASTAFVRAIIGPVGSGKSSATWMELFRRACEEWPDADGVRSSMHLCVRDTYAMLKETTLADFKSWFGKVADVVMDSPIRASVRMPLPDGTTLDWNLRFLSMDGGDKSLNALRGMQISAAYVNEGHSIAKEVYEVIATRIGRYRPAGRDPKWKGIITDSNYGYQGCYLHQLYMNPPDTVAFFEQPPAAIWNPMRNCWELNPQCDNLAHLPGGLDYYAKLLKMSTEFVKQFLGNQWAVKTTGLQVYPEFSPQLHIIRGMLQPDRNLPLIIGMDFGLHVACQMGQLSPMGKLVVFKELWDDDADLEGFVARRMVPTLRNEFSGIRAVVCGDPAGVGRSALDKRTAFSVLKAAGLDARPAVTNDITRRIGAVKYFLTRQNGYGVHHTCTRTVDGMEGGYGFKKLPDGSYSDAPEKNEYSHCFVGATPVMTDRGFVPIESIRVNDRVLTRAGFRRVTATMSHTAPHTVRLIDGTVCTPDHPYITANRGVVRADTIQHTDVLISIGEGQWEDHVTPAEKSSILASAGTSTGSAAFVPRRVRQPQGETLGSTTSNANALCAVESSQSTGMQRLPPAARRAPTSPYAVPGPQDVRVYDLTVEGEHEFYANGVLVSNCCDAGQYMALYARFGSKKDINPYEHAREMRKHAAQHPTLRDAGFFYA